MEGMGVEWGARGTEETVALAERLRCRQEEIERALAQTCAADRQGLAGGPACSARADATWTALTDFYLDCIEKGENT
jgi:hypothetical protein